MSTDTSSPLRSAVLGGLVLCLLSTAEAKAADYIVDQNHPSASDSNAGSEAAPLRTIQAGVNRAQPGDRVLIKGSLDPDSPQAVYSVTTNGITAARPGTAENPITVSAYSGHTVILQGDNGDHGINLDNGSHHIFRNLIIRNFNKGVESSASIRKDGIVIEDCEFSHFADRGILLRNFHDMTIRNTYIHHSYECGVCIFDLSDNISLMDVESSYNDDGKGSEGDADGFALGYGVGKVTIRDCVARDNGEDGLDVTGREVTVTNFLATGHNACGIKLWRRSSPATNSYTLTNVISSNNSEAGIKISSADGSPAGDYDIRIYNSLFYGNGENGIAFRTNYEHIDETAVLYNNIIANNGYYNPNDESCCYPAISFSNTWPNVTSDYNLFHGNWDGDTAWSGEGSHSLRGVDPKFFAPGSGDFHLMSESPAIDSGRDMSSEFDFDYEDTERPLDGDLSGSAAFDIGPFEKSIEAGNRGPHFTYSGIRDFSVAEAQTLQVGFPASDLDGDELRYLLVSGDILSEMSIDNTGTFSFTPGHNRSDSSGNHVYRVTIGVTDEHYYTPVETLEIAITVLDVNRPPTYDGSTEYTAIEGRKMRIKLAFSDPDGDSTVTGVLTGLPHGAAYDEESRILDWTPTSAQVRSYTARLTVSDGEDQLNQNIVFRVLNTVPYQAPTDENVIFYVDGTRGNDNFTGQTPDTAWKTIQKAKDTLTAGQMVLIRGGTYNEYGATRYSGTVDHPIIYKAYPGETVIMDGTGFSSPEAFNIYSSNIVIDGLTLNNFSETLFIRGVYDNITLLNLSINNADSYGVQDWGMRSNLRIENVTMSGIGDRGIVLGSPANVHIYNVQISDFEDRGISISGSSADNINIIDSRISDSRANGQFGVLAAGKNVSLQGIEILNTSGIGAYLSSAYAYAANTVIAGTRYRSGESIQMLIGESGVPNAFDLYNDVIADGLRYGLYIRDGEREHSVRNCIIRGNPTEVRTGAGFTFDEDYNIFGNGFSPLGRHSMQADPQFVNPVAYDFTLQNGSRAIDAGINVGLPYGGIAPDIGAYEYDPGEFLYGDVSADGKITAYDASMAARAAAGLITLDADQQRAADVSGDGIVDGTDAALIARRATGLIGSFPVE